MRVENQSITELQRAFLLKTSEKRGYTEKIKILVSKYHKRAWSAMQSSVPRFEPMASLHKQFLGEKLTEARWQKMCPSFIHTI